MTYISPLANALAQTGQVQRTQSEDKDRQLRRAEALRKNIAAQGTSLDHEVENTDKVTLQEEEDHTRDQRKNKRRKPTKPEAELADGDSEALDIRA